MVPFGPIGLLTTAPGLAGEMARCASVIDGDTIDIRGRPIRIFSIDAAEAAQPCFMPDGSPWRCGQKPTLALQDVIGRAATRFDAADRSHDDVVGDMSRRRTRSISRHDWHANVGPWRILAIVAAIAAMRPRRELRAGRSGKVRLSSLRLGARSAE